MATVTHATLYSSASDVARSCKTTVYIPSKCLDGPLTIISVLKSIAILLVIRYAFILEFVQADAHSVDDLYHKK